MPLLQDFMNTFHVKIFFHDFISNIYIRLGNLNIDIHKEFLLKTLLDLKKKKSYTRTTTIITFRQNSNI